MINGFKTIEGCCPVIKGDQLAALLNTLIEALVTDDRSKTDIVEDMASAAGISSSTVNQILSGSINCPPIDRLEGFASVLSSSVSRLVTAAERDGCEYDNENSFKETNKLLQSLKALLSG